MGWETRSCWKSVLKECLYATPCGHQMSLHDLRQRSQLSPWRIYTSEVWTQEPQRREVEAEQRVTEYCILNRETAQPTPKPTPRFLAARGTVHLLPT